ncbi:MAG: DUF2155 domain-containing protein [Pseudomonadota bacterium]
MTMRFLLGLAVVLAGLTAAGAAVAQEAPDGESQPADDDGLSELEALSRRADDPLDETSRNVEREPVSVTLRALDKITARYRDIEAPIDTAVNFGTLQIVPRFCDKRPPEEFPETSAFLQIFEVALDDGDAGAPAADEAAADAAAGAPATDGAPMTSEPIAGLSADRASDPEATGAAFADGERIFSGWMFASSPALNPLEHPVYDIWVIDCATVVADKTAPGASSDDKKETASSR